MSAHNQVETHRAVYLALFVWLLVAAISGSASAQIGNLIYSGEVLDSEGQPVAGARVHCYQRRSAIPSPGEALILRQEIQTDKAGRFRVSLPNAYTVFVAEKLPNFAPGWTDRKDQSEEDLRLILVRPTTFSGVIVDAENKPVPGAEVWVNVAFGGKPEAGENFFTAMLVGSPAYNLFHTRSSVDGRFNIDGFPANRSAMLTARKAGLAPPPAAGSFVGSGVSSQSGDQDVQIRLLPTASLSGKVIEPVSSKGMSGVEIRLIPGADNSGESVHVTRSTRDGTFQVADLAAGRYRVEGTPGPNRFQAWVVEPLDVYLRSGENLTNCTLKEVPGGTLMVAAKSKEDQKLIPGVRIRVRQNDYSLENDGTVTLHLPAGDADFYASKESWDPYSGRTTIVAGQTNRIDVMMVSGPRLNGKVRDSLERPVAGASIAVMIQPGSQTHAKTGRDGSFEINWHQNWDRMLNSSSGMLVQDFKNDLAAFVPLSPGMRSFDIKLQSALAVAGSVKNRQGNIETNASVRFEQTGNPILNGWASTDKRGHFEIRALPTGVPYRISVSTMRGSGGADIPAGSTNKIELPPIILDMPGQRIQAGTSLPAGPSVGEPALMPGKQAEPGAPRLFRSAGIVKTTSGEPIPDIDVESYQLVSREPFKWAEYQTGKRAKTAADGRFELQIPPGKTLLLAKRAGRVLTWMEVSAGNDNEQKLLIVAPSSFVAGTIVDGSDHAIGGAIIQVAQAAIPYSMTGGGIGYDSLGFELARSSFTVRSGADGRFRIEGIPTNATVNLTAQKEGTSLRNPQEGYFDRNGLRCRPGQQDIKLVLEPASGTVEGTILEQRTRAAISDAWLWLRPEESHAQGAPSHFTQSDKNGTFRFNHVPDGKYYVFAAIETNAVSTWDAYTVPVVVSHAERITDVVVAAVRGGIVHARITGRTNDLDWAFLIIETQDGRRWKEMQCRLWQDTFFRLPVGEYRLSAKNQGWSSTSTVITVVQGSTNQLLFELSPPPPKMSKQQRLAELERLGHVPEGAEMPRDWELAQQTTWWGKPLKAAEFWKGRVVWLDDSAQAAAHSRGRAYPPVPYDDPSIPYKDDVDVPPSGGGVEGPNIQLRLSNKENAFWNKFVSNHPRPPKDIERQQLQVAERILRVSYRTNELATQRFAVTPKTAQESADIEVRRAVAAGYPPEAFTEEALFWRYVSEQRREYQREMDISHTENSTGVRILLGRLAIDRMYVATPEPLKPEEIQKLNRWKTDYLQRLKREKVQNDYIDAYMAAWKLSPEQPKENH